MKLVSFYGNEIVNTDDQRKIDRLLERGFKEVKPQKIKEELPKKEGATKNAKRKGKADTERDI